MLTLESYTPYPSGFYVFASLNHRAGIFVFCLERWRGLCKVVVLLPRDLWTELGLAPA